MEIRTKNGIEREGIRIEDKDVQCCGSGMFIPDLGSRILIFTHPGSRIPDPGSRIPDPKTATKKRGEKKISCHTFLCTHKCHKIVNYFSFEVLKKKFGPIFKEL